MNDLQIKEGETRHFFMALPLQNTLKDEPNYILSNECFFLKLLILASYFLLAKNLSKASII